MKDALDFKLKLTEKKLIPEDTQTFQLDDGTIVYFKWTARQKLYVKFNGKEIKADLPGKIENDWIGVNGNEIFFKIKVTIRSTNSAIPPSLKHTIYKATLIRPDKIAVTHLRDAINDERFETRSAEREFDQFGTIGPFCRIQKLKNGITVMTTTYRMGEDPEKDGIKKNMNALQCFTPYNGLHAIHRGKCVYVLNSDSAVRPNLAAFGEHEISFRMRDRFNITVHARDSSPFLYITNGSRLYTFNTDEMEFLPSYGIGKDRFYRVIGVHNGVIHLRGFSDHNTCSAIAKLPDGYFIPNKRDSEENVVRPIAKGAATISHTYDMHHKVSKQILPTITSTTANVMERNNILTQNSTQHVFEIKNVESTQDVIRISMPDKEAEPNYKELTAEMERIRLMMIQSKVWALESVKSTLKFDYQENLSKPFVCIQLENGFVLYIDNVKPFALFNLKDDVCQNADLKVLEGEHDCTFRGVIGNHAYFCTARGKIIRFFKASVGNGHIEFEQINEMRNSEVSLFKNQPVYYIERSKEWTVFQYHEKYTEMEGETFCIADIDLLSKYERHYHRGTLYLFRDASNAKVERVNEKVVIVEGPLLDETCYYTPPHSDFIYIINSEQNVLLILNTLDLTVSQQCYEPPAGSNHHAIVGIHDAVLTMAFDGVWGRHLYTTIMS